MRKFILLFLIIISNNSYSQTTYFNYIDTTFSNGYSIHKLDTTFLIVATNVEPDYGYYNYATYEIGMNGNIIKWSTLRDTTVNWFQRPNSSVLLSDSNILIVGQIGNYNEPGYGSIMKCNKELDILWTKKIPDWDSIKPTDTWAMYSCYIDEAAELFNHDLLFTGQYYRGSGYDFDGFVMRTDSSGNLIWKSTFGGNVNGWSNAYNIEIIDSSSFFIIGVWDSPGVRIAKYDLSGNVIWINNHFVQDTLQEIYSTCTTKDGNIIIAHSFLYDYDYTLFHFRLSKVTPVDGSIIWTKTLRVDVGNTIYGVRELEDSSLVIFGETWYENIYDPSLDNYYGLLVKTTKDGDSLWTRRISKSPTDMEKVFYDLSPSHDKGFMATGWIFDNTENFVSTTWIVKMDSLGCTDPNCLDTLIGSNQMVEFRGLPVVVYPNPASRELVVGFNTQGKAIGLVEVFDMAGKLLISHKANSPSIKLNVSGLEPGLHIIRLTDNEGQTWQEKFVKE